MTKTSLQNLVKFFGMASELKRIPRSGWVKAGVRQPESVADHTFRTSMLCMIYSDLEGLDELKLLRMALIHDLPEAIIGDLTPSRKTAETEAKENTAMNQILRLLPERQREKYLAIWNEYKKCETKEAKAVRQLEKLEMALQAREYEKAGSARQSLKRFIKSAEEAITRPELRKLLSCILEDRRK
ncbi:MAG: HD domain-containing protein [Candidatus Bathyarchaeota archaeon]|nr:MAG: HD domain-containing protein [Candidatus Bathyarchaeota archaeon]